jgi:ubiquinone/menaquinone biosynthesis C-methylase UbiE
VISLVPKGSNANIEREQGAMSQREQLEQWQQLEESTAEAHERYLVPLLFAPGAEVLIELAALGPGERVLDVACGTGSVARRAAQRVGATGTVVGPDVSESMLKVARKASSEIRPAIEWRQGDARDIPFPDAAFDVVFCQQGLQFFPDRSAALREMHRVLVPNGRLTLSVLRSIEHNSGWALLAEVLERHVGPDAGAIMRSPFLRLQRFSFECEAAPDRSRYRFYAPPRQSAKSVPRPVGSGLFIQRQTAVSTDELRDLIASAGFRDVRILIGIGPVRYPSAEEFFRWEATSWLLAEPLGSLKDDVRNALIRELREALRLYADDDGIVFPAETYLTVGRRNLSDSHGGKHHVNNT